MLLLVLFVYYNVLLCWEYPYVWCFWETATITQDIGGIHTWTRTDGRVFRNCYNRRPCWITWLLAVFSVEAGGRVRKSLDLPWTPSPELSTVNRTVFRFVFLFFYCETRACQQKDEGISRDNWWIVEMPTDCGCDSSSQSHGHMWHSLSTFTHVVQPGLK